MGSPTKRRSIPWVVSILSKPILFELLTLPGRRPNHTRL
jgi:hypothetical protein